MMGPNMTTLTFRFSRSIARDLAAGDEIIITRLDHDANRSPWQALAEKGMVIREVDFDPADCTLRLDDLADLINSRTRLVAVGYASNAVGTINPIAKIAQMAHSVGAWLWVEGVHFEHFVAEYLGRRGVYVWAGNFYAVSVTERLGLEKTGGLVRAGMVHYNTREEVDYCLKCLQELKREE